MSGSSTPVPQRDEQLLAIGRQCSDPHCYLVDFLPFKCQHCEQSFCGEHFLPKVHKCEKYDESKHNRVAPSCPLCNTPVAVPPGQDPNIRMDRHINTECSVMTGRSVKASSSPHCANLKCKKVLFAPIKCDKCKQQFCPQHRFPSAHTCVTTKALNPSAPSRNLPSKSSAASAAAMGAIKQALSNASSTTPSPQPKAPQARSQAAPPTKAASSRSNPFSQTERRAKAERESRFKAMQERAKKGLLSEDEKVILAREEAERASRKDECIIA